MDGSPSSQTCTMQACLAGDAGAENGSSTQLALGAPVAGARRPRGTVETP